MDPGHGKRRHEHTDQHCKQGLLRDTRHMTSQRPAKRLCEGDAFPLLSNA